MKLREAERLLRDAGIEDARDEARMIFRELGGLSLPDLISLDAEAEVDEAVMRRAKREPLAYITGRAYFYREEYGVDENCLIPRSDTEILVDFAVKNLPRGGHFIDICTGSGCIALSVLNNTDSTTATAVDISAGAVAMARKNAHALGLSDRIELLVRDALKAAVEGEYDAVLSNPPYVTDGEYLALEKEIYFEPRAAFVGGADGGDFYRRLTPLYKDLLKPGGFIAYEIGAAQAGLLGGIAEENGMSCEIIRDLGGRDRVAVLKAKN